jgi:hypothetical protein
LAAGLVRAAARFAAEKAHGPKDLVAVGIAARHVLQRGLLSLVRTLVRPVA